MLSGKIDHAGARGRILQLSKAHPLRIELHLFCRTYHVPLASDDSVSEWGMKQNRKRALFAAAAAFAVASAAMAAETITYTYDAKGRLVKVERSGTVNNNVTTNYSHDKADNRTNVTVTNSPNPPQP